MLKLMYFTYTHIEIIFREENLNEIVSLFECQRKYYKVYDIDYISPNSIGLEPSNVPYWAKKEQKLDTL